MVLECDKVRIDKWLWAVRIFKTRTLSASICKDGKVKCNGKKLKPSHLLIGGETLTVRKNGFDMVYKVDKCIDRRVSFVLAQDCYTDLTPPEELSKYDDWFIGKARPEHREKGLGRPTKKERREIDDFKDGFLNEEDGGF